MVSILKEKGDKEFKRGNYEAAIEYFTKAIEIEGNIYILYLRRSACYLTLQNYDQALKDANKCIELEPDGAKAYLSKVMAEFHQGDFKKAVETFKAGLKFDSNNQELKHNLKLVKQKLKESMSYSGSLGLSNEMSIQEKSTRPVEYNSKKESKYYYEHKEVKAEETKSESSADDLKKLGRRAYKNKEWAKALEYYDKALEQNFKVTYINHKATVYFAMGDYQKCIEVCDEAVERAKELNSKLRELARAYSRKGLAFQQLGDLDGAITLIKASLMQRDNDKLKSTYYNMKRMIKQRDNELKMNLEKAERNYLLALERYLNGRFPAAIEACDEAIRLNPKCANYFSHRSSCYIKLIEYPKALNDVDRALELKPNFVDALIKKASIHFKMQELHKALGIYEKVLGLEPDILEAQEGYQRVIMSINVNLGRSLEIKVDDTSSVKAHRLTKMVFQMRKLVAAVQLNKSNQKEILKSLETNFQNILIKPFSAFTILQ